MLTIFSTCKPFRGHNAIIQRNAIRSWTLLDPGVEVILLGDDEGTAEAAQEMGMHHIPDVERNESGTPLLSSIFQKAHEAASYDIMAYVNADIILMGDFIKAVKRVKAKGFKRFLMVGQRWDVDIGEPWDFDGGDWEERLRAKIREQGQLHPATGIDYLVFTKKLWGELPPFAIGRLYWDEWLIYRARVLGVPVIDATETVTIAHQNHGYEHHPGGEQGVWYGQEATDNGALAEGDTLYTILDATWLLREKTLVPALTRAHIRRRAQHWADRHPKLAPLVALGGMALQRMGIFSPLSER